LPLLEHFARSAHRALHRFGIALCWSPNAAGVTGPVIQWRDFPWARDHLDSFPPPVPAQGRREAAKPSPLD